jgi:hypothetical protein
MTKRELLKEIEHRKKVLHWMRNRGIRSYKDVANIIAEYYSRPKEFYERIIEIEKLGKEVEAIAAARRS